jgi:putative FmdB family regulatory protein
MPMFEYQCRECGQRFEAFVTASRKPVCPNCQSEDLRKLVSALGRIGGRGGAGGYPSFGGG